MNDETGEQPHQCARRSMSAGGHPVAEGLYDPRAEHDACGVGFLARLDAVPDGLLVAACYPPPATWAPWRPPPAG